MALPMYPCEPGVLPREKKKSKQLFRNSQFQSSINTWASCMMFTRNPDDPALGFFIVLSSNRRASRARAQCQCSPQPGHHGSPIVAQASLPKSIPTSSGTNPGSDQWYDKNHPQCWGKCPVFSQVHQGLSSKRALAPFALSEIWCYFSRFHPSICFNPSSEVSALFSYCQSLGAGRAALYPALPSPQGFFMSSQSNGA